MTYASFEIQRKVVITKEESFIRKACGTCRHREICEEWEYTTGQTLYSNKTTKAKEPFIGPNGEVGVYRCTGYEEEDS